MAENPSPDERVAIDELTPEEANRIIHSHRKVRYGQSNSSTFKTVSIVHFNAFVRYRLLAVSTAKGQMRQQAAL